LNWTKLSKIIYYVILVVLILLCIILTFKPPVENTLVVNELRSIVNPYYETLNDETNYDYLKDMPIQVTLTNLESRVIYTNSESYQLDQTLNLKEALYMDNSYRNRKSDFKLSLPRYDNESVIGFVLFEVPEMMLKDYSTINYNLLLVMVILLYIFMYVISRKKHNPLEEMIESLKYLSKGVLKSIELPKEKEYIDLVIVYNRTIEELSYTFDKRISETEDKKKFLMTISHELKTPIATIHAYIEGLVSGVAKDKQTEEHYKLVITEKMNSLMIQIDELFHFAQEDAGRIKYNFNEVYADRLIGNIIRKLPQDEILENLILPSCLISVDEIRIEQVIMNLFNNARKHSDLKIKISAYRQDNQVIVEIEDKGDGISHQDLPYLFDYYYQGEHSNRNDYGGSGIGLALCKDIIDSHKGRIKVKSQKGIGSTFSFEIPVI